MRATPLGLFLLIAGCASSPPPPPETPPSPAAPSPKHSCMTPVELERASALGELNYSDMESVAKRAAASCLAGAWLARLSGEKGRKPAIRFYPMRNRTAYHINWMPMAKLFEKELSSSGKVTLVADLDTAHALRTARGDAQQGKEMGADLVVSGSISGVTDAVSDTETVQAYVIAWELVRTDTDEKVWVTTETVKKIIKTLPPCPAAAPQPAR